MIIEVSAELRPVFNGSRLHGSTAHLHDLLGQPTRIVEPTAPNPSRNRWHVYDEDGVYFIEHQQARNIEGCCIVLWPEQHRLPCSPLKPFNGRLSVAGYDVPSQPDLLPFLRGCPIKFQHIGNAFGATRGECSMLGTAASAQSASHELSGVLRLVDLFLSFPVDPWDGPAPIG
jgi:hypothetical protein